MHNSSRRVGRVNGKNKMTAGWSAETNEGSRCRISGAGMVDGAQTTNDSNRAERGGRIGILAVVLKIEKIHNITKGQIKILIDIYIYKNSF